jgi:hypothetical protein
MDNKFVNKIKNLPKEKLNKAIEDGMLLADHSTLYSLKLRYEKSLKDEKFSDEVKNNITKKLIELNTELKKIEKKLSKKQVLENFTKETLDIYEEGDKAFIEALLTKLDFEKK